MSLIDSLDPGVVLNGSSEALGPNFAKRLAEHPLDCIDTEFPHRIGSAESADDIRFPKEHYPTFYGCYDWHSAVHSHWCLIRQLRLFHEHPYSSEIISLIDGHISEENVRKEVDYFESNESFEKSYGWGWFLRLAAELALWKDDQADQWRRTLMPLEDKIRDLARTDFLPQQRPLRVGTHRNSAFALQCVFDYAKVTGDNPVEAKAIETSREFYIDDENYPVEYEPLSWDFLSPALVEADLLRRVLPPDEFREWFEAFLPLDPGEYTGFFLEPHDIDLESAGANELHLVGLNLSKAWCLAGISSTLSEWTHTETLRRRAKRHAMVGLQQAFTETYAGSHWLGSFALYLLTRNDGGIAPS